MSPRTTRERAAIRIRRALQPTHRRRAPRCRLRPEAPAAFRSRTSVRPAYRRRAAVVRRTTPAHRLTHAADRTSQTTRPNAPAPSMASRLRLFPGQSLLAPAAERAAVTVLVERPLETFEHVVDLGKPGLLELDARCDGPLSTTTDEHDGPLGALRQLSHLADEMRIDLPIGP